MPGSQGDAIFPHDETPLVLIERLVRALLHTVRGDLSLIQNELSSLSAEHGEERVRGALSRCRSIAAQLGQLTLAHAPPLQEAVRLSELLAETGGHGANREWILQGDRASLVAIFSLLPSVLGSWGYAAVVEESSGAPRVRISLQHRSATHGAFRSFSSFVSAEVGERKVVQAALCDLLRQHFGYEVRVLAQDETIEAILWGNGLRNESQEAA
jgi:hypothetical protein